ncbi:hypothetical protein AAY84_10340 [Serratia marcescens]|uniref:hypothetical protein n=1 Tax=Serratia TaxID=613 RepID=UPI00062C94B8|nr:MULTISPECIES: hypothetical protein [Serratia]KKZ18211.1 hypothetical protein AAY84_10340 [Serratia marcescens]MBH2928759.1 hypothetical protein [Serratia ureilytica]
MIPFKWEPAQNMTFKPDNGSQVLQDGNYDISANGSFTMEAPGETLLLRNATSLNQEFLNINAGHLSVEMADLSATGNELHLTGINVGATGKIATFTVSDRPEVSENTPPLGRTSSVNFDRDTLIGPAGTLNVTQFTPVYQAYIGGPCTLSGNAAFNYICSNVTNEVSCDGATFTLSESARLFIDTRKLAYLSLKLLGSSAAILCCESLPFVKSIVIADNAYLYCGGQGKRKFQVPADKGTFTLMNTGNNKATLALSGLTPKGADIASDEGQKWLDANGIVTAMFGLPIKYDKTSQPGIMLITCGL